MEFNEILNEFKTQLTAEAGYESHKALVTKYKPFYIRYDNHAKAHIYNIDGRFIAISNLDNPSERAYEVTTKVIKCCTTYTKVSM